MGPGVLIASPQMRDPNFGGAIVLLCHHDDEGALGLVVNRAMALTVADVVKQIDLDVLDQDHLDKVFWGGPVEQGSGFLVFSGRIEEDAGWNLPDGVAVSTSREQLQRIRGGGHKHMLCLGYAGWGPGQLDREIESGSWLYTEVSQGLLLDEPIEARYDFALATLGLTQSQVWMTPIDE